jgi:hypothetical protein
VRLPEGLARSNEDFRGVGGDQARVGGNGFEPGSVELEMLHQ